MQNWFNRELQRRWRLIPDQTLGKTLVQGPDSSLGTSMVKLGLIKANLRLAIAWLLKNHFANVVLLQGENSCRHRGQALSLPNTC